MNQTTIGRRPSVLRRILRFDAAFSTLSGIVLIALAAGLPLYTRNGNDFRAVDKLVDVRVV